jgi:hypothetical protein
VEIPARTPLTYKEEKKSRNVRDEIEKDFDSKIRLLEASLAGSASLVFALEHFLLTSIQSTAFFQVCIGKMGRQV